MIDALKKATGFSLQLVVLALVHFLGFVIATQLTGFVQAPDTAQRTDQTMVDYRTDNTAQRAETSAANTPRVTNQQLRMLRGVTAVCLLNTAAMLLWMRRTTLFGMAFVATVFMVFVTCLTVMPQSETWLFFSGAGNILGQAALMGTIVSGLFAVASLVVLWRWKKQDNPIVTSNNNNRGATFTLGRLAACAATYMVLYALFGYFVAWRNPEVREFYGGGDLVGFWEHTTSAPIATKILPFQLVRGAVWGLLCLAMLRWSRGSTIGSALVIGLVLAVVMNAQLLLPNPIMSRSIRLTHLVETASNNFLFGVIAVLIWMRR